MIGEENDWTRPHWEPSGGDALLYYVVLGDFPTDLALDLGDNTYRVSGRTVGTELAYYGRAEHPARFEGVLHGPIGKLLDDEGAGALALAARAARAQITVRIDAPDPADLGYLRDGVGIVTALLDRGGVAVLDAMALQWWSPGRFRKEIFTPDKAVPLRHTTILISEDENNDRGERTVWVHTRGMRKFGRPDISVRAVTADHVAPVVEMCNRFMILQARGAVVPEGREVVMKDLPDGLTCHHAGDLDDPDFNNFHLSIRRAERKPD